MPKPMPISDVLAEFKAYLAAMDGLVDDKFWPSLLERNSIDMYLGIYDMQIDVNHPFFKDMNITQRIVIKHPGSELEGDTSAFIGGTHGTVISSTAIAPFYSHDTHSADNVNKRLGNLHVENYLHYSAPNSNATIELSKKLDYNTPQALLESLKAIEEKLKLLEEERLATGKNYAYILNASIYSLSAQQYIKYIVTNKGGTEKERFELEVIRHNDIKLHDKLEELLAKYPRFVFVSISGNDNEFGVHLPSYGTSGIVVSSVCGAEKCDFSNYGLNAGIGVPGRGIVSADRNGTYGHATGTSVSAPIVTGLAAILMEIIPDLSNKELKSILLQLSRLPLDVKKDSIPALKFDVKSLYAILKRDGYSDRIDPKVMEKLEELSLKSESNPVAPRTPEEVAEFHRQMLAANREIFPVDRDTRAACKDTSYSYGDSSSSAIGLDTILTQICKDYGLIAEGGSTAVESGKEGLSFFKAETTNTDVILQNALFVMSLLIMVKLFKSFTNPKSRAVVNEADDPEKGHGQPGKPTHLGKNH